MSTAPPAAHVPGSNGHVRTARDEALYYLKYGIYSVPLHGKKPYDFAEGRLRSEWEKLRVTEADIDNFFAPESGIGVLLGEPSGGLVDCDLDCSEARVAARFLLPATGRVSGRESAPDSHYWYFVPTPPNKASDEYKDPIRNVKMLELRSTGGQTVVPPSIYPADIKHGHPNPEQCVWHRTGTTARVSLLELQKANAAVAAAALLGRYWPTTGSRNDATLALAGGLVRQGWADERIEKFIEAVATVANDEQTRDRVKCVADTRKKKDSGKEIKGWPSLAKYLGQHGDRIVTHILHDFFGIQPAHKPAANTPAPIKYIPIPEYVPFPTDCLPAPWNEFVRQGAAALKCDAALVALPVLSVLASAIGNTRRVYLGNEWFEPGVLWTCVIAESGGRKSPAADLSMNLVKARQKKLVKEFKEAVKEYIREAMKFKEAGDSEAEKPEKPTLKRVIVADVTIEKLSGLIDDNRRGLLLHRDELSGWLGSFAKYKGTSGASDEPNWLSIHRADAIIYDRKTGDKTSVFVPHAAVSVAGGIQPGVLKKLAAKNLFDSGLIARIIFAMPPRTPKQWSDDEIDGEVKRQTAASLESLYGLAGELDDEGDNRPVVVKLSREARTRLKRFVNEWGIRQFEAEGDRAAALAKLEALPGRFALIHHIVGRVAAMEDTDPITLESLEAGIKLAEWCANETERVYTLLGESDGETDIRKLVELVTRLSDRNGGRITVKILQRAHQKKYRTSDMAKADLLILEGLKLGRWEESEKRDGPGRKTSYFILEPRSGVTGDENDEIPQDGDDDAPPQTGDDINDPPDDAPNAPSGNSASSTDSIETYGETDPKENGISSFSSPVTPRSETANTGAGGGGAEKAIRHPMSEQNVTPIPHTLITHSDQLPPIVCALEGWSGPVAIDCETTGLDPLTDRVRLLQLGIGEDVCLIDLFQFSDPVTVLTPLFTALSGKEMIGHNNQFDTRFLAPLGFVPSRVFDTMLASRVLHAGDRSENNARFGHSLQDAAFRELNRTLDKTERKSDWSKPLTPSQLDYAAADVAVLVPLAAMLKEKLAAAGLSETAELEMRALLGIAWAAPVGIDEAAWLARAEAAEAEQTRIAGEMDALAPNTTCLPGAESRNWNSPADVKEAFAALGVKVTATDDDTLAGVAHPLAQLVRDYRAAAKRTGTYGRAWLDKHVSAGRVAASWNQLGTESGRMSCSDPNLQQIPRGSDYRRCFVAPPGRVLVKADYSQVELRIAAKIANEAVMIAAYKDRRDLHTLTAANILNKPEAEVKKADRQLAKAVNFGLLYGMGWKGLKGYALSNYGVSLTDSQAQSYRNAFFKTYPALKQWHESTRRTMQNLFNADPDGTHQTRTLFGRRRELPVAKRKGDGTTYPNVTDTLNTPVQGTGADGLKAAIALLWERRSECPGAVPVIFCHDEIVLEVPEPDAERARDWLSRCMVEALVSVIEPVPVEVEVSVSGTWGG